MASHGRRLNGGRYINDTRTSNISTNIFPPHNLLNLKPFRTLEFQDSISSAFSKRKSQIDYPWTRLIGTQSLLLLTGNMAFKEIRLQSESNDRSERNHDCSGTETQHSQTQDSGPSRGKCCLAQPGANQDPCSSI
jgi:hypothetical protein